MHRVDTPTAVPGLPTQDPPSTAGFFTKGNPGTGINATVPGQDWFNSVQEELVNVVLGLGGVLAKADHTLVLGAIKRIAGGNVTTLTADATLTPNQAGLVLVDRSALPSTLTVTLPPANLLGGLTYRFVQIDNGGGLITVQADGADLINGVASLNMMAQYHSMTVTSDGTGGWFSDQVNGQLDTATIDFQRVGQTYFRYDSPASLFSINTQIPTPGGFSRIGETVGQGGAAVAWANLAALPANARAVELLLKINVQSIVEAVGNSTSITVTTKDGFGVNQLPVTALVFSNPSYVSVDVAYVRQTIILGLSKTFDVSWTKAGNGSVQLASLYLQGYWI